MKSALHVELLQSILLEAGDLCRKSSARYFCLCHMPLLCFLILSGAQGLCCPGFILLTSCDGCSSSYSGFRSCLDCKSLSLHCISLRAVSHSVLFCLASSQSLCLALSLPDSLQESPYCKGLEELKGRPQPNEDDFLLPVFLPTAGGAAVSQRPPSWVLQGCVLEDSKIRWLI